jgi:hypothetical protein
VTAPTLASPASEVRRLRAELETAHKELAQLRDVIIAADPMTDPEHWRSLFTDGHQADLENAYRQGRADMAAEYAADWRSMTETVVHPERGAGRRVRAGEAGCRRDAADHERAFVARAHNTSDRDRTDVQRATVRLYPAGRPA